MKASLLSLSALRPSQYRQYAKQWDKKLLLPIFKKYGEPRGFRIYLEFGNLAMKVPSKVPPALIKHFKEQQIVVEDYAKGIGLDKHQRPTRLGRSFKKNPELRKLFENDPSRKNTKLDQTEFLVVISRHPYDIAGMSTDRGWTSCMNLIGGVNKEYVGRDIKAGTLVAYLIKASDKDIARPTARLLIKRFETEGGKSIWGADQNTYPHGHRQFQLYVQRWVDRHINKGAGFATAYINDDSYSDGRDQFITNTHTQEALDAAIKDRSLLLEILEQDPDFVTRLPKELAEEHFLRAVMHGLDTQDVLKFKYMFSELSDPEMNMVIKQNPTIAGDVDWDLSNPKQASRLLDLLKSNPDIIFSIDINSPNPLMSRGFTKKFFSDTESYKHFKFFASNFPDFISELKVPDDVTSVRATSALLALPEPPEDLIIRRVNRFQLIECADLGVLEPLSKVFGKGMPALVDTVSDQMHKLVTTSSFGMHQQMHKIIPYEMMTIDPDFVMAVLAENEETAAYITALPREISTDQKTAALDIVAGLVMMNSDTTKYFRSNSDNFEWTERVYERIGFKHVTKSFYWNRMSGRTVARAILEGHPLPEHNLDQSMNKKQFKVMTDYLDASGEEIPAEWFDFLVTHNAQRWDTALKYFIDNPDRVVDIKTNAKLYLKSFTEYFYDHKITADKLDELEELISSI